MVGDNKGFAELDEAVRRQISEEQALHAVRESRVKLVLAHDVRSVFFATLALRLKLELDWGIETFATDGEYLLINPDFCLQLSGPERTGVLLHEVMHAALAHHARRGARDPQRWNISCDLAVNHILVEAGFGLPKAALLPGKGQFAKLPAGLSAEEYYNLLPPPQKGDESDGGDPGGCGQVLDAGAKARQQQGAPDGLSSPADQAVARQAQADAESTVAMAAQVAQQRGELPAGLARFVSEVLKPKVDVAEVLRQFVSRYARNDYTWSRPNRRFLWQGIYLPGLHSEELGEVIAAFDTSGSISQEQMKAQAARLEGILQTYDCTLTILYHDSEVAGVQRWKSSDGPLKLEPVGGGGTSHVPVFEWIEQHAPDTACVVCLTDLFTEFPLQAPQLPVLWCVLGNDHPEAPFGQVLRIGGL